ncbi:hypothetical protein PVK73_27140, partial [Bacillus thuringiensis]
FFFMFSNGKHVFGMPCFLTKLSSYKNLKTFLETEAIPFFQKQGNNKQLSIFYIDLATIYYQENQFKKACLYYQKGISGIGIVKNMHVVTSDKKVQVKFP